MVVYSLKMTTFARNSRKSKIVKAKYMAQEDVFKKIVSHCKEYGFVFPSSDIYDGLGAVYDYGQNGVELKNNIKEYWLSRCPRCSRAAIPSTSTSIP